MTPDHLLPAGLGPNGEHGLPSRMIDREKVLNILRKRFPGATLDQLAAATNAIVGLREEWREVENFDAELERHLATCACSDREWFVHRFVQGHRFKLFEHIDDV